MEVSGYLVNYFNLNTPDRKTCVLGGGAVGEVENCTKIRNWFKNTL